MALAFTVLDGTLGYCALAAAQLHRHELNAADGKRLPAYPVPALRIVRLAVEQSERGRGYGQLLLGHAVNLALSVRQKMGVRVLLAADCTNSSWMASTAVVLSTRVSRI